MTVLNPTSAPAMPSVSRMAPSLYGATLFLSALLLFAVQPMFTKMVLPRLGGAPTVWSVAMVFFQAALLCGYVLYAASNLGSFAALIAYPFAIEPFLTLKEQAQLWSVGFAILALLVALAGLLVARRANLEAGNVSAAGAPARDRLTSDRLTWAALSAIPVGLVIAVTSHITTDIAAAPFLWVLPLALYLLTFVAVFRDPPWLRQRTVAELVPIPIAILAVTLLSGARQFWLLVIVVNLGAFALLALLCHGELYRRRPAPALLTEFYLWMSLGGVVGGVFAALVAPQIFTLVYEYPILIVAAILVLPGMFAGGRARILAEVAPVLGIAVLAILGRFLFDVRLPAQAAYAFQIILVGLAAMMLLQRRRPQRFLALVVLGFVLTGLWQPGFNRVAAFRSFFGVHQIVETADDQFRLLYHGTTLHGAERIADTGQTAGANPEPLTYYYRGGPISETIEAVRVARGALPHVAVVGLGSGTLSCYKHSDEQWTFFEIDAAVAQIARDPRLFSYISTCAPELPVVLGDARLTLAASPQRHDLIILDAFSSDVVPVHLMTREAIDGYLAHIEDGGVIALHLSNRYMELASVVAAIAAAEGLVAFGKDDDRAITVPFDYKTAASVAVLARKRSDLGDLPDRPGWHVIKPVPGTRIWTDDYSNVLGAILRKRFGG